MKAVALAAIAAAALAAFVLLRTGTDNKPANTPLPQAPAPRPIAAASDEGAIAIRVAPDTGFATLRINEARLAQLGAAVQAQVRVACRYIPERDQWQRLPASPTRIAYRVEPRLDTEAKAEERLFYELPREEALYWVYWIESVEGRAEKPAEHRQLVTAGKAQCNSAAIESVSGKASACVPGSGNAEVRLVADPAVACAEQR